MKIDARWHATLEKDLWLLRRLEGLARRRSAEAEAALERMLGPDDGRDRPLTRDDLRADPALADARERFRAAHQAKCAAVDAVAVAAMREREDPLGA